MGQASSQNPEYQSSLAVFTGQEQRNILKLFQDIAQPNPVSFPKEKLQEYLKDYLPPNLTARLQDELSNILIRCEGNVSTGHSTRHNTYVTKESFVVGLAHLLKGTLTDRAHIFLRLATDNEYATTEELVQLTISLLNSYMTLMTRTTQFKTWNLQYNEDENRKMAIFLMDELIHAEKDGLDQYFEHDLERWILRSAFVTHVMEYIFHKCFPVSHAEDAHVHILLQQPKIPYCTGVNWEKTSTVLSLSSLILLNHSIPQTVSKTWRLLFQSQLHGESFSTMLKLIMNKGPSLMLVRDKDGHVFGAFASESWAINPNFVGSTSCFLFTISPKVGRYFPTGYNENYMYLNQMQQTLPNGLGFGGQLWYFGLWLDSEFGKGHSKAEPKCTTFGSPQLSGKPEFEIDLIEVWGVGDEVEQGAEGMTSILDKDPAAKAMLSLIGKGPVSEGLRETDATAQNPSEKSLHNQ